MFLLLVGQALGKQVSHSEEKAEMWRRCRAPIPATTATLLINPLCDDRVAGKEADWNLREGPPVHSATKIC